MNLNRNRNNQLIFRSILILNIFLGFSALASAVAREENPQVGDLGGTMQPMHINVGDRVLNVKEIEQILKTSAKLESENKRLKERLESEQSENRELERKNSELYLKTLAEFNKDKEKLEAQAKTREKQLEAEKKELKAQFKAREEKLEAEFKEEKQKDEEYIKELKAEISRNSNKVIEGLKESCKRLKEAKREQKEVLQLIDHIETKHMFSALNPLNWFRSSNSIDGSQPPPALEPHQPEFTQNSSVTIEEIPIEAITNGNENSSTTLPSSSSSSGSGMSGDEDTQQSTYPRDSGKEESTEETDKTDEILKAQQNKKDVRPRQLEAFTGYLGF